MSAAELEDAIAKARARARLRIDQPMSRKLFSVDPEPSPMVTVPESNRPISATAAKLLNFLHAKPTNECLSSFDNSSQFTAPDASCDILRSALLQTSDPSVPSISQSSGHDAPNFDSTILGSSSAFSFATSSDWRNLSANQDFPTDMSFNPSSSSAPASRDDDTFNKLPNLKPRVIPISLDRIFGSVKIPSRNTATPPVSLNTTIDKSPSESRLPVCTSSKSSSHSSQTNTTTIFQKPVKPSPASNSSKSTPDSKLGGSPTFPQAPQTSAPPRSSPALSSFCPNDLSPPDVITSTTVPGSIKPFFTYVNPFEALSATMLKDVTRRSESPKLDSDDITFPKSSGPLEIERPTVTLGTLGNIPSDEAKTRTFSTTSATSKKSTNRNSARAYPTKGETIGVSGSENWSRGNETKLFPPASDDAAPIASGGKKCDSDSKRKTNESIKESKTMPEPFSKVTSDQSGRPAGRCSDPTAVDLVTYLIPFRAHSRIKIRKNFNPAKFTENSILEVSSFEKEANPLDRVLIGVTPQFLVYSSPKFDGFRFIWQRSGLNSTVLLGDNKDDKIFNISMCRLRSTAANYVESILVASNISGNAYLILVQVSVDAQFKSRLKYSSFAFPRTTSESCPSEALIKTRAKMSSRNRRLFAICRGKMLHIIQRRETTGKSTSGGASDSEFPSFLINIGRASRDFIFSEDDTVISTIDKHGVVKFWDVRNLNSKTQPGESGPGVPIFASLPAQSERLYPTSVLFVDAETSYLKGSAQRYLIVGMRNNYSIQILDLKHKYPIQQVELPQTSELDPICSVLFHPGTGTLIIGHPARKSIYLIQLTFPFYDVESMNQAEYMNMIAEKALRENVADVASSRNTAFFNGIREIGLDVPGQLHSVAMLENSLSSNGEEGDTVIFELYIYHSRGVSAVGVRQDDLGWGKDRRPKTAICAVTGKYALVAPMKVDGTTNEKPGGVLAEVGNEKSTTNSKKIKLIQRGKEVELPDSSASAIVFSKGKESGLKAGGGGEPVRNKDRDKGIGQRGHSGQGDSIDSRGGNNVSGGGAKKKNIENEANMGSFTCGTGGRVTNADDGENGRKNRPSSRKVMEMTGDDATVMGSNVEDALRKMVMKIGEMFRDEFKELYNRIDTERKQRDATDAAKQDVTLQVISNTLSENVEEVLGRIVTECIREEVMAKLSSLVNDSVNLEMPELLVGAVRTEVSPALEKVDDQLKEVHNKVNISHDSLTKCSKYCEELKEITTKIVSGLNCHGQTATNNTLNGVHEAIRRLDDNINRALLSCSSVSGSGYTSTLGIEGVRSELAKMRLAMEEKSAQKEARDEMTRSEERYEIFSKMFHDKVEEGLFTWVESARKNELFDDIFIHFPPERIGEVKNNKLILEVGLIIARGITGKREDNLEKRIRWIGQSVNHVFRSEIRQHLHNPLGYVDTILPLLREFVKTLRICIARELVRLSLNDPKSMDTFAELFYVDPVRGILLEDDPQHTGTDGYSGETISEKIEKNLEMFLSTDLRCLNPVCTPNLRQFIEFLISIMGWVRDWQNRLARPDQSADSSSNSLNIAKQAGIKSKIAKKHRDAESTSPSSVAVPPQCNIERFVSKDPSDLSGENTSTSLLAKSSRSTVRKSNGRCNKFGDVSRPSDTTKCYSPKGLSGSFTLHWPDAFTTLTEPEADHVFKSVSSEDDNLS